ncbi:MAG: archease [Candidatus Caldarchaeum sp.]|nr:archease [Candidatus Caldarchaeales archaeon]
MSMSRKGFHQLPHMADIYIEAYGSSLEEAFEQAGLALFKTLVLNASEKTVSVTVEARGQDLMELLYDWLEKLLHKFEIDNIVATEIKVNKITKNSEYRLEATLWGEPYNREKHQTGTAVKSPTYALMEIDTEKNTVRFVLDI